ncbi:MAG TPA: hypothetical protein VFN44_13840 [Solirubrobacteraceae bacterium]|nr:hypothetical protein [Solirubrobacteraceae bacterium]
MTLFVALAAVVAFAVVGGTGLAGGLAKPVNAQYGPGQYQYGAKITICHKNKVTIRISINAWPAHQKHGDQIGSCAAVAAAKAKAEKAELRAAKLEAAKLKAAKLKAAKLEAAKLKAQKLEAAKKAAKQASRTGRGPRAEPVTTTQQTPVATKAKKPKKSSPAGAQAPVTQQQGVTAGSRGNGKGPGGNGKGKGRG